MHSLSCNANHMNSRLRQGTTPFRRFAAALVAVAMLATSLAMPPRALASVGGNDLVQSEFVGYDRSVPKPCRKAVVPGAVSTCSVVIVASLLAADGFASPALKSPGAADWRMGDGSLAPQCGGFSPYRPPCLSV